MWKNRFKAILFPVTLSVILTGCSLPKSLVTDTGSGKKSSIPVEEYLNTEVLSRAKEVADTKYKVLELELGTFEEAALNQAMTRKFYSPIVYFDVENKKAKFGEYMVDFGDEVNKGDVLATCYTDVDDIAIEEAGINLQHINDDYAVYLANHEKELKKFEEDYKYTYDGTAKSIMDVERKQMSLDHERTVRDFENRIQNATKSLNDLTKVGSVYEIKAPVSGVVYMASKNTPGDSVKYGTYICHIIDSDEVYTETDKQADRFGYGSKMIISTPDGDVDASVVSGGMWGLYGNLDESKVVFKLSDSSEVSLWDSFRRSTSMTLKGNVVSVDNVIVLPVNAVETDDDGGYYVKVLNDDGTLTKTGFIPGGSSASEYWVLEGLTPGMKIVY
ncbi:MAG: hypothetical protein K6D96_06470 [Acetatifactor sp.]|nr:hypothetical protein [Acetatifactor sp.]